jgi:hypothetical protein
MCTRTAQQLRWCSGPTRRSWAPTPSSRRGGWSSRCRAGRRRSRCWSPPNATMATTSARRWRCVRAFNPAAVCCIVGWLGILVGCVGWAVSRDELRVVWQVSKMSITKACLLNQAAAYLRMGQHHSYQRAVEACSVVLALPTTLGEWFLTVGCWRQARGSLGRSGGRHLWRARVYWGGRWIRWDGVVVLTCAHYQATAPVPRHTSDGVRLVRSWGCWMRRVWTWRRRHGSAAGASRCCNYFDM